MSALVFLFLALLISAVGSLVLVLRNRRPTSVWSGVDEFRREMQALAPPDRGDGAPSEPVRGERERRRPTGPPPAGPSPDEPQRPPAPDAPA